MEVLILLLVIIFGVYFAGKGKAHLHDKNSVKEVPVKERKLSDDEIITIILPTINNDGK